MKHKLLTGHVSPETAFLVPDYPFGFRLRCQIRYWIETKANQGQRFVSQTTNPKAAGTVWNKPKASTYSSMRIMYQKVEEGHPENGHVENNGLDAYAEPEKILRWFNDYYPQMDEEMRKRFDTVWKATCCYNSSSWKHWVYTESTREQLLSFPVPIVKLLWRAVHNLRKTEDVPTDELLVAKMITDWVTNYRKRWREDTADAKYYLNGPMSKTPEMEEKNWKVGGIEGRWGFHWPVRQGEKVNVLTDKVGPAQILSFFVDKGQIGVEVLPDSAVTIPMDYTQAPKTVLCFGADIDTIKP